MGLLSAVCGSFLFVLAISVSVTVQIKDPCYNLAFCVADIENLILSIHLIYETAETINSTKLDEYCQKTETASTCVRDHKDECKSTFVLENVEHLETQAVYICTENGTEETLDFSKSKCYTEGDLRVRLRQDIDECNSKYIAGQSDDVCQIENQRAECIVQASNRQDCGPDFVKYLIRVETNVAGEDLGCPPNNL